MYDLFLFFQLNSYNRYISNIYLIALIFCLFCFEAILTKSLEITKFIEKKISLPNLSYHITVLVFHVSDVNIGWAERESCEKAYKLFHRAYFVCLNL